MRSHVTGGLPVSSVKVAATVKASPASTDSMEIVVSA